MSKRRQLEPKFGPGAGTEPGHRKKGGAARTGKSPGRGAAKLTPESEALTTILTYSEEVHKVDLWIAEKKAQLPDEQMSSEQIAKVLEREIPDIGVVSVADILTETRTSMLALKLGTAKEKLARIKPTTQVAKTALLQKATGFDRLITEVQASQDDHLSIESLSAILEKL
jgi:hypothetical protein